MTSFLDLTQVKLPKNTSHISVIDCDRQTIITYNFQPQNSLVKLSMSIKFWDAQAMTFSEAQRKQENFSYVITA